MYCHNCGKEVFDSVYCPACGVKLPKLRTRPPKRETPSPFGELVERSRDELREMDEETGAAKKRGPKRIVLSVVSVLLAVLIAAGVGGLYLNGKPALWSGGDEDDPGRVEEPVTSGYRYEEDEDEYEYDDPAESYDAGVYLPDRDASSFQPVSISDLSGTWKQNTGDSRLVISDDWSVYLTVTDSYGFGTYSFSRFSDTVYTVEMIVPTDGKRFTKSFIFVKIDGVYYLCGLDADAEVDDYGDWYTKL